MAIFQQHSNPVKQKRNAEVLKKFAETFLGSKNFTRDAMIYTVLLFIIASWIPDSLSYWLNFLTGKPYLSNIFKIVVSLCILSFFYFKLMKAIKFSGKIAVSVMKPEPVKVLIMFLSKNNKIEDIRKEFTRQDFSQKFLEGTSWEMILKAVEHHKMALKKIYMITSKDTTKDFPLFKEVFNKFYPSIYIEEFTSGGVDFHTIDIIFDTVERIYYTLEKMGYKQKEVLVDITGGMVTTSVGGAIATLAEGRKFQYVSTVTKEVLSYDVIYSEDERGNFK